MITSFLGNFTDFALLHRSKCEDSKYTSVRTWKLFPSYIQQKMLQNKNLLIILFKNINEQSTHHHEFYKTSRHIACANVHHQNLEYKIMLKISKFLV